MDFIYNDFILISILPIDDPKLKWRNILIGAAIFSCGLLTLISSAIFFCEFIFINLEQSLYALHQVAAFGGLTYIYVVGRMQRLKIIDLFIKFDVIQDKCEIFEK